MLNLLPIAFLFTGFLAITILRWVRPRFAFSWLVAALSAIAAWLVTIGLRLRLPSQFSMAPWQPQALFQSSPALLLDPFSWPYAACVVTLVLAVIFTATARSQYQTNSSAWAGSLALGALGLIAVQAANPLTLVMAWAATDLVEMVVLLSGPNSSSQSQRIVLAYAARTGGIFFALWGWISNQASGPIVEFGKITPEAGVFFVLAAGLRLGVLPIHLPYSQELHLRRGIGNLLRLLPAASSLMVLARLPAQSTPLTILPYLLAFCAIAALYGAIMWLVSANELSGRPYWLLCVGAFAVVCGLRGFPIASLSWGTALLISGGILFLYSARGPETRYLWLLGLWAVSGIPFSLAAGGWVGLTAGPLIGLNPIFLIAQVCLMAGYIRFAVQPGDSLRQMERWVQGMYPLGLLSLGATGLFLMAFGWKESRTLGVWWIGVGAAVITSILVLWAVRRERRGSGFSSLNWASPAFFSVLSRSVSFFSFEWLYRLFWAIYRAGIRLINFLSRVFEGDGGVLWALLLLTLFISLVKTGVTP